MGFVETGNFFCRLSCLDIDLVDAIRFSIQEFVSAGKPLQIELGLVSIGQLPDVTAIHIHDVNIIVGRQRDFVCTANARGQQGWSVRSFPSAPA